MDLENKHIVDAVYLPNDEFLVLARRSDSETAQVSLFSMAYDCKTVRGSISEIVGFQRVCNCQSGWVFEPESEQCKNTFCGHPGGEACFCNKG